MTRFDEIATGETGETLSNPFRKSAAGGMLYSTTGDVNSEFISE
jgi:hypothetical protein